MLQLYFCIAQQLAWSLHYAIDIPCPSGEHIREDIFQTFDLGYEEFNLGYMYRPPMDLWYDMPWCGVSDC